MVDSGNATTVHFRAVSLDGSRGEWRDTGLPPTEIFTAYDMASKVLTTSGVQFGEPDCRACESPDNPVGHFGNVSCQSRSLASGGTRKHCTCDGCF